MSDPRRYAPATQRNRELIAAVLDDWLPSSGSVLEIASGSGEHISFFAQHFPLLRFQPSDPDPTALASIAAWTAALDVSNTLEPIMIDAAMPDWPVPDAVARDLVAILCINMIHISPWPATLGLLRGAASLLKTGGILYLYGPYKRGGVHTAPSNMAFDQSLRAQNPSWGVRDLDEVCAQAEAEGFALARVVEMPANNLSVLFKRSG
jgi:SAM-dependent methyltransferase